MLYTCYSFGASCTFQIALELHVKLSYILDGNVRKKEMSVDK